MRIHEFRWQVIQDGGSVEHAPCSREERPLNDRQICDPEPFPGTNVVPLLDCLGRIEEAFRLGHLSTKFLGVTPSNFLPPGQNVSFTGRLRIDNG